MPIEQVQLYIPLDIERRILMGELIREGHMIKVVATGKYLLKLNEVDAAELATTAASKVSTVATSRFNTLTSTASSKLAPITGLVTKAGELASQIAKAHPIAAGTVTGIAIGKVILYTDKKWAEKRASDRVSERFRAAMHAYVVEGLDEKLTSETLIELQLASNEVARSTNPRVQRILGNPDVDQLFASIATHTKRLADVNGVEIVLEETEGAQIINIQDHLAQQRKILDGGCTAAC